MPCNHHDKGFYCRWCGDFTCEKCDCYCHTCECPCHNGEEIIHEENEGNK